MSKAQNITFFQSNLAVRLIWIFIAVHTWSYLRKALIVYPVFTSGNDASRWDFRLIQSSKISRGPFRVSFSLSVSSCGTHFASFKRFSLFWNLLKLVTGQNPIVLQAVHPSEHHLLQPGLAFSHLQTFSMVFCIICSTHPNPYFYIYFSTHCGVGKLTHPHYRYSKRFDAIPTLTSWDETRIKLLSPYRDWLVRNSTIWSTEKCVVVWKPDGLWSQYCWQVINRVGMAFSSVQKLILVSLSSTTYRYQFRMPTHGRPSSALICTPL